MILLFPQFIYRVPQNADVMMILLFPQFIYRVPQNALYIFYINLLSLSTVSVILSDELSLRMFK